MKVFTKSLFLITLGFNVFSVKESEASSLIAAVKTRQQTEKAIIQQPQEAEGQRSEEVEPEQRIVELVDRNLFNNDAGHGLEVNARVAITLKPIIERMDVLEKNMNERIYNLWMKIEAQQATVNKRLNNLKEKTDSLEQKLNQILDQVSKNITEDL